MAVTKYGTAGTVTEVSGAGRWARAGIPFQVRGPGELKVTAVAGQQRTVQIAAGQALTCGVLTVETAPQQLQLAANTGAQVRYDLVVLRVLWGGLGASTAVYDIKQGIVGAPSPPALTRTPGTLYEAPLAVVKMSPNTGQLTGSSVFPIVPHGGKGGPLHVSQGSWVQLVDAQTGAELITDHNGWRYRRLVDGSWLVIESDLQPWSTWAPALYTTTGSVVLGTGGIAVGRYKVVRGVCIAEFEVRRGTSGSNFSRGDIYVPLPVPAGSYTQDKWMTAHLTTFNAGLMEWQAQIVLGGPGATAATIWAPKSAIEPRMAPWRSCDSSGNSNTGWPRIVSNYTEAAVVTGQLHYITE